MKTLVIGGTQNKAVAVRAIAAGVAGIEPDLVPVPRDAIEAAGGQIIGQNLYFGEVPDLPLLTSVMDRAARMLGVVPTPLLDALRQGYAWYLAQPRRPVDYAFEDRLLASV
jgi:hypothetical protein